MRKTSVRCIVHKADAPWARPMARQLNSRRSGVSSRAIAWKMCGEERQEVVEAPGSRSGSRLQESVQPGRLASSVVPTREVRGRDEKERNTVREFQRKEETREVPPPDRERGQDHAVRAGEEGPRAVERVCLRRSLGIHGRQVHAEFYRRPGVVVPHGQRAHGEPVALLRESSQQRSARPTPADDVEPHRGHDGTRDRLQDKSAAAVSDRGGPPVSSHGPADPGGSRP